MKDNFSTQSNQYLAYRPTYPSALFSYLVSLLANKEFAWDCGTGNGQVAAELANHFQQVFATDISKQQLENALLLPNVTYTVQPAEKTDFAENTFDLVTVAQAIHWFDFERFYSEVNRVAKQGAIIAAIGYGLIDTFDEADEIIRDFYFNTIGVYWDSERKFIDERYQTIPFPYQEIAAPKFSIDLSWNAEHLIGYLQTWSAVKHYTKAHQQNPVDLIRDRVIACWGKQPRAVKFDILLKVGRVEK